MSRTTKLEEINIRPARADDAAELARPAADELDHPATPEQVATRFAHGIAEQKLRADRHVERLLANSPDLWNWSSNA